MMEMWKTDEPGADLDDLIYDDESGKPSER